MIKGIQGKLVLVFIILTLSTMAIMGTVLVNSVTVFYVDDFEAQMAGFFSDDIRASLSQVCATEEEHDGRALYNRLSLYSSALGIDTYRNIFVLDRNGRFLQGTSPELGATLEMTENIIDAMNDSVGSGTNSNAPYMDYAVAVGDEDVKYLVYVKDTKQEAYDITWTMVVIILKALIVALVISVILSYLLSKMITRPIQNITKGALKLADGDFSYKLPVNSNDEIGRLTETFNDMAGELESTLRTIETERSRLSTLFLYMTDGVAAFTDEGMLTSINKTALSMLGELYDAGYADFADIFGERISMSYDEVRAKVAEAPFAVDIEVDGRIYKCDFARYLGDAESEGILAVLHDVTEQEEIERLRREFIANVSHELRTPITNVKSYTETVLENDDLPEDAKRKFLGVVLSESDRMIHIVKDLLMLSKLDSRKMEMNKAPFDVCGVMQSVKNAMDIEAEKRGMKLIYSPDLDVPKVFGDKARIEQVIVNIVSNALKYTPDGGTVTMACKGDGGHVVISVTDTGVGIPEEDLPRIFERFYRVDKARSRQMGGTGLGLAIAKEIVDEHGGRIAIDSTVGVGTTVTIIFKGEADEADRSR